VAVAIDPKPGKLKENIGLKFRHLKVNTTTKMFWSRFYIHLIEKDI